MRNFNSITDLKKEKRRLYEKQLHLEGKIDQNWKDLKHSLRPLNIINQVVHKTAEKVKEPGAIQTIISDTLTMVAFKLTNTLTEALQHKLKSWNEKKSNV